MLVAGKILPFTQQSRMYCGYQGHLRPTLLTLSPLFVRLFPLSFHTQHFSQDSQLVTFYPRQAAGTEINSERTL